jgi:hypothetical protein
VPDFIAFGEVLQHRVVQKTVVVRKKADAHVRLEMTLSVDGPHGLFETVTAHHDGNGQFA